MKQKFGMLKFVRVCRDMPLSMKHFESDFDAIVEGTHSQIYGGYDIKSYSLYKVVKGVVVDSISWYKESQLTLLGEQDMEKAEQMIEDYRLAGWRQHDQT